MTSYLTQTVAREQIAELISAAEAGRIRRQLRQARREARAARRRGGSGSGSSASNSLSRWPHQIGYAVAR